MSGGRSARTWSRTGNRTPTPPSAPCALARSPQEQVPEDARDWIFRHAGDPARLFPLVARRLNPGGVFVFSQPPAIPGAYGPQGMYKGGFAGPAMYTYRYSYTTDAWEDLLSAAGLTEPHVRVLDAPKPGHIGTLIGSAQRR